MFFNKKGVSALGVVVSAIILLVVAFLVIYLSGNKINDAGDEFSNLLNQYTTNCDHDHDGLKDKEDVCPCDNDDFFDTRIYYLADELDCEVRRACAYDNTIEKFSECSAQAQETKELRVETEHFRYYINLKDDKCRKWYEKKGKERMEGKYSDVCGGDKSEEKDNKVFFTQACADKILALHKVRHVPTFTCKTSTKECKDILKKPC